MAALDSSLLIVTTSSRSAFRRCPQKWWWSYVDGYRRRGENPDALWFGIGIHEALAEWYQPGFKRGTPPAQTFAEWHGEEERWISAAYADRDRGELDPAKFENALELGVSMLEGYVEEYGKDRDWDVIAVERPFRMRVIRNGVAIAYFMSTWDGVYRWTQDGRIYLMEHKSATAVQTAYLELDDQAGIYWAFATAVLRADGTLGPNEEIAGITYNFLRKSKGDDRPQNEEGESLNKNGTVSKRQPMNRYTRHLVERSDRERRTQVRRLADEVSIMKAVVEGVIPVTKNTGKDCSFCEFFTACKSHERGGNVYKSVLAAEFDQSDPFDRYVKSASS